MDAHGFKIMWMYGGYCKFDKAPFRSTLRSFQIAMEVGPFNLMIVIFQGKILRYKR